MPNYDYASQVNDHYTPFDLAAAFDEVLRSWGKGDGPLSTDDLAPIDHFHFGGKAATIALANLVAIDPTTRVLDLGGGYGGPARLLAATYGCQVMVVDLTEAFCQVGEMLTARTGLSELVAFRHGNALDLPFPDRSFDLVWTQHSTMNIDDKRRLYAEIFRVLRPGGHYALYEIMAGPNPPVTYPVPWAADESISFLRQPNDARALLVSAGFDIVTWDDLTSTIPSNPPAGESPIARNEATAPSSVLQLVLGPTFVERGRNMMRNFAEGRIALIRAVLRRP